MDDAGRRSLRGSLLTQQVEPRVSCDAGTGGFADTLFFRLLKRFISRLHQPALHTCVCVCVCFTRSFQARSSSCGMRELNPPKPKTSGAAGCSRRLLSAQILHLFFFFFFFASDDKIHFPRVRNRAADLCRQLPAEAILAPLRTPSDSSPLFIYRCAGGHLWCFSFLFYFFGDLRQPDKWAAPTCLCSPPRTRELCSSPCL